METLIGFPVSIAVILGFSLMMLWMNPENTMARGIAYLAGIMLVVAIGFTVNIFLPQNMTYIALIATFVMAAIVFLKAIEVIKWKILFLLVGAEAIIVAVIAFIINSL